MNTITLRIRIPSPALNRLERASHSRDALNVRDAHAVEAPPPAAKTREAVELGREESRCLFLCICWWSVQEDMDQAATGARPCCVCETEHEG